MLVMAPSIFFFSGTHLEFPSFCQILDTFEGLVLLPVHVQATDLETFAERRESGRVTTGYMSGGHVGKRLGLNITGDGELLDLELNIEGGVVFRFWGSCLCGQGAPQIRKLLGVQFPNVPNQHLPATHGRLVVTTDTRTQ